MRPGSWICTRLAELHSEGSESPCWDIGYCKEREIREKKAKTALIQRQKDGVVSQLARLQEEQRSTERQLQQQKDQLNVATAARATALRKKEQLDQLLKTMQDAKRGAEAYYQRTRPAVVPVGAQRSGY